MLPRLLFLGLISLYTHRAFAKKREFIYFCHLLTRVFICESSHGGRKKIEEWTGNINISVTHF